MIRSVRIQRKRTPGWRMPTGAVYVGRPTLFGDKFEDAPDPEDVTTREHLRPGPALPFFDAVAMAPPDGSEPPVGTAWPDDVLIWFAA